MTQDQSSSRSDGECSYLCFAWGESDLPAALVAPTRAAVLQFLVDEWFGEKPETMCAANREQWAAVVEEFDGHDWQEEGPLKWTFEIGGVEITKVAAALSEQQRISATPQAPVAGEVAASTPIEKLLSEYASEGCDFADLQWVVSASRVYVDRMEDCQVRCLLHALSAQVEQEKQRADRLQAELDSWKKWGDYACERFMEETGKHLTAARTK